MGGDAPTTRYHAFAIILHWVMALAFFVMLASGFVMVQDDLLVASDKYKVYQWHKSGGVLLLLAFFVRLVVRIMTHPPHLPAYFKRLDVIAAKVGHWALYGLMLAMPITGWVMVSSSVYGLPTIVFDMFEWPHIPGISGDETINEIAKNAHEFLAFVFLGVILLHIAAVIKHAVIDKDNLLTRMGWKV